MRLLLACLLLLITPVLMAQTFRASVLTGINLSQVDGDDLLGFHQPGFNGGLRVVALLSDKWRVGPEILYSQQGARRNKNSLNVSDFYAFRLQTVELPLMVYYKDWRLTAEGGLSYQRLIDYRISDFRRDDITGNFPLRDDLLAIKVGVTLYLTPRVGFNFRWSKHLTDLQVADEPRLRGRTISLRAVYTLGSGEELPAPPAVSE
ncbi:outer membrane beta-barrel protein [Lewinella sp. JB7]|uniref:outer membrane beta-barrel protein n=1 Tax=Lewinella sp. JB7 TaxID=2962887 RepID=UPI0020C97FE4|nr:outer membrane beta-barrel protein [Lewinella sp. JB7]MCP9237216.1 PorT family protein [Lewinella sp. JB7]